MNETPVWAVIAVAAVTTAFIRFAPFLLLRNGREIPPLLQKISRRLPPAVMGMLCVYCLRDTSFAAPAGFLPALIASVLTVLSYLWKRSTLLSILIGTAAYMLLVQAVW